MEENFVKQKKAIYKRWWFIVLVVFLALFVPVAAYFGYNFYVIYKGLQSGGFNPVQAEMMIKEQAQYDMARLVDENAPMLGNKDAKITIVEFGDFNCPRCLESFPVIRQLPEKYKDQVRIFWRNYPVVKADSVDFAKAGVCAHRQSKFWEIHDLFFQTQGTGFGRNVQNLAKQAGLDMAAFDNCYKNTMTESEIRKDYYAAEEGKVAGTPTFFINGFKVEGPITMEMWQKIIEVFLKIYEPK
jgi:protein-disulfide isomerase